jgi:hypothetical protein
MMMMIMIMIMMIMMMIMMIMMMVMIMRMMMMMMSSFTHVSKIVSSVCASISSCAARQAYLILRTHASTSK